MTDLDTALQRIDFDCPSAALVIRDHIAAQAAELAHEKKLSAAISRDCNNVANERNELRDKLAQAERERDALAEKWSFVFSWHAVYSALTRHQTLRTGPENVSDTLDALVRIANEESDD